MERLQALRKERDLTQEKLSEMSGVSRVCISRYESGKYNPGIKNISKLSNALGITVDELISEETDQTEKEQQ